MTDYAKLKVTELKEELGKRGLPKAGLKAELVQRLVEADAQAKSAEPAGDEVETRHTPGQLDDEKHAAVDATDISPPVVEPQADSQAPSATHGDEDEGLQPDDTTTGRPSETTETPSVQQTTETNSETPVLTGNVTQTSDTPTQQLPTPSQTQSIADEPMIPTQSSITTEEALADSRKRKRRSQSPPPSSVITSSKKFKSDDAGGVNSSDPGVSSMAPEHQIDTQDTLVPHSPPQETRDPETTPKNLKPEVEADAPPKDPVQEDTEPMKIDPSNHQKSASTEFKGAVAGEDEKDKDNKVLKTDSGGSERKASPKENRFKDLVATQALPTMPNAENLPDIEDRDVAPATHPATSALYIRELMRPLNPKNVKDYLATLSAPANTSSDASTITEFFLDNIRTHCLVSFVDTAAASRVRSSLHGRVWPNERDRRALWVDFVPEDKLQRWIEIEQESSSVRGQASKRWEVAYEEEDGDIKAYLQEVGSGKSGLRGTQVGKLGGSGPGRYVGAASTDLSALKPRPRDDQGKGFQALDDLFKSTRTKPKLYFQPIAKEEVDRRLHLLDAGRGGGRGDEMRRYSFEDDIVVDKGPEFGMRGRGGPRGGRGAPYQRPFRGRGGSYRGEGRYRGDNYRDEGDVYRRPG